MNYRFTFFFACFWSLLCNAQPNNLVPNLGFEERSECVLNNGFVEHCPPWFNPSLASPDVFHNCTVVLDGPCPYPNIGELNPFAFGVPVNLAGCQNPYEGNGYAGIIAYSPFQQGGFGYREYIAVELLNALTAGEVYQVQMAVSLAEYSGRAIWALQTVFLQEFDTLQPTELTLPYTAFVGNVPGNFITDKDDWTVLNWQYTAMGGERFMIIGNFQSNLEIDTISVLEPGQSIGSGTNSAYYYIDNVYVGQPNLQSSHQNAAEKLRLWPNPASDRVFFNGDSGDVFQVYENTGMVILKGELSKEQQGIDVSGLRAGLYLLKTAKGTRRFVKR